MTARTGEELAPSVGRFDPARVAHQTNSALLAALGVVIAVRRAGPAFAAERLPEVATIAPHVAGLGMIILAVGVLLDAGILPAAGVGGGRQ